MLQNITAVVWKTASVTVFGAGLWSVYDVRTCHPLRKLKIKGGMTREFASESVIRLFNTGVERGIIPQRPLTLQELAQLNGEGPNGLYFGCRGRVFDATDSEMFRSAYSTWAGKDATFALATMSLDTRDAGRTDRWLDSELNAQELDALTSWERYFAEKYYQRGRLLEYDRDAEQYWRDQFVVFGREQAATTARRDAASA
jgi:predicted heme/steroid binding protein